MKQKGYFHGDLHNELIKKGIEFINKEGVENLSLRKIAAMCDVSHAAPYSHFKDKETFLTAIKEHVSFIFTNNLNETIAKNRDNPLLTIELGKSFVEYFSKHSEYFFFLLNQQDLSIHFKQNSIEASNCPAFEIFKKAAEECLDRLGVPSEKQTDKIITMWATVQGITVLAIMKGVTYDGSWADLTENILKQRIKLTDDDDVVLRVESENIKKV